VTELCERARITRQWLNKLVDRGEVPGCRRKPNDRLLIIEGPDIGRWIQQTADIQRQKRGRRLTLKDRMDRFRKIPDSPEYTVGALAKKVGLTASTIRRRILEIPGVFYDGKVYRIKNTPELKQWIQTEVTTRLEERERVRRERLRRGPFRITKPAFLKAGGAVSAAHVKLWRVFKMDPLETWGPQELRALRDDLRYMVQLAQDIEAEIGRRKNNSTTLTASGKFYGSSMV
jgi:hypothetical protein